MKNFKTVFNFEFKEMIKSKVIITTTVIMSVIALGITMIPSFIVWFSNDDADEAVQEEPVEVVNDYVVVYDNEELELFFEGQLGSSDYESKETLQQAIENEEVDDGYVIHDYNNYTYITYDSTLDFNNQMMFEESMRAKNEERLFKQEGIDPVKVHEIMNQPIESESITLGKEAGSNVILGFAFIFVMYLLILLYGTNVATSVAREKDSRTMELLITSTKPRILILGKVLATGLVGVLQVLTAIVSGVIGFLISKGNYPDEIFMLLKETINLDIILVFVLFSVLGYLLYLFIYASLGSLVTKVEDVNSAVAPITFLFVIAYLAATLAMQDPNMKIIKISSFIPFVSIFTMPIRYMMTSVPTMTLIISILIMVVSVVLFAELSIYIYRFGSLNYGNRIKLKEIIKAFRR